MNILFVFTPPTLPPFTVLLLSLSCFSVKLFLTPSLDVFAVVKVSSLVVLPLALSSSSFSHGNTIPIITAFYLTNELRELIVSLALQN